MSEPSDVPVAALRRLARGLLYDRERAEDVVQDAWLAALRRGLPSEGLHPWLAEAIRRLAPARMRAETRRRAREEHVARAEQQPSTVEVAGRIEILHRLLDAVNALEEPYRSAIALRYLEDLPPRAIAKRLRLPVNTVRTHVRRGLERLRRQLDGERGRNRQEFLAALVPLAGKGPLKVAPWSVVAAIAIVIGVSWFVVRENSSRGGELASDLVTSSTESATHASSTEEIAPAPIPPNARQPIGGSSAAMNASWVVRGHAFRGRGEPFPHLPLLGRVYAGEKAEGTPIVEERFATDDNGDFAWPASPPEELVTVSIHPEIADHITRDIEGVFVPGDPAPDRWTVSARPLDTVVRGVIRDTNGQPVPRCWIQSFQGEATCDEFGNYSLHATSQVEGEWDQQLTAGAPGFADERFRVDLLPGGEIRAPALTLRPELRIRGHVLDENGAPLAAAQVRSGRRPAVTSEDGAFELGCLDPRDRTIFLTITKSGYQEQQARVELADFSTDIAVRLAHSLRITGRILAYDRTPIWRAWVIVGDNAFEGAASSLPRAAYTDEGGRFTLENVAAGPRKFWFARRGIPNKYKQVDVPSGVETFDVELTMDEEEHFVAGLVLDEHGAPARWLPVEVREDVERSVGPLGDSYTGPDGRFRIGGLPPGKAKLQVAAKGIVRIEQEAALDREDLVLQMKPTSWLAGRVLEEDTDEPVRSFVVSVEFQFAAITELQEKTGKTSFRFPGPRAFSVVDGRWTMETEYEPGLALPLKIDAEGRVSSTGELVRTTATPDPNALTIRMARSTTVRGRVLEKETGAPLAGARLQRIKQDQQLELLADSQDPKFETASDAAGHFELSGVPTGEMLLAVEAPGRALVLDGPFVVSGSTLVERVIEVGLGATIRGRLLDPDGRALVAELVKLEAWTGAQKGHEWRSTTDAQGAFQFPTLAPAEYGLTWDEYEGDKWLRELGQDIEITGEGSVDTSLRSGGHTTLRGTFDYNGDLSAADHVSLAAVATDPPDPARLRWSRSRWEVAVESGCFCFEHLEPGEYVVSVEFEIGDDDPSDPFSSPTASIYGEAHVVVPAEGTIEVRLPLERHDF